MPAVIGKDQVKGINTMANIRVKDRAGNLLEIQGETGSPLMYSLRNMDNGVDAVCGGLCSCATCHVYISADWQDRFAAPAEDDADLLEELDNTREGSRLSCQLTFTDELDGLELEIAPEE